MHSITTRLNAIVSYAVLVLFIALGFNVASHFFLTKDPVVSVTYSETQQVNPQNRRFMVEYSSELKSHESALFTLFDLDADFRPVWTWNTKQLFVFVTLDYTTPDGTSHSVFVWDDIIKEKEKAAFSLKKQLPDYFLVDLPDNLRNLKGRLNVSWNVVPISGLFTTFTTPGQKSFSIPAKIEALETEKTNRASFIRSGVHL